MNFAPVQRGQATSVMQFLYAHDQAHVDQPTIPTLHLPLRVGIAFVPTAARYESYLESDVTAARKVELLQRVAAQFQGLPFIKSIEVIPPGYLRPEGSFENLDQVREMFGVDVIVLVAYDQTQLTNENMLSLSYWTIVGAYVIHGEHNDTDTLMEAAVYDIPSRKLLFRAPGLSQLKGSATLVANRAELENEANKGLSQATDEMIRNLQTQLFAFRQRVKESPAEFQVVREPGYTGAGALAAPWALALAGVAAAAALRRRTGRA